MIIDGTTINIRNPKFSIEDGSQIDCEIELSADVWIPFTARLDDVMPYTADIFNRAKEMGPTSFVPRPLNTDDYKNAVQALIDRTASAPPPIGRNYADGMLCASYKDSTVPLWAAEATAFIAWRDQVWAYVYNQLYAVQNGQRPQPTIAELIAELPSITWPEPAA